MEFTNIFSRINWVDVIIITLLIRISYVGFVTGLGGGIISLLGITVALTASLQYYLDTGDFVANHTPISSDYAHLLCFVVIAFLLLLIFYVAEALIIRKIITIKSSSIFSNITGFILGAIKGVFFASIVIIALELVPNEYINSSVTERSLLGNGILRAGRMVHERSANFF